MRFLGALSIVSGVVCLGLDLRRNDIVVFSFSASHGVHASEVLGSALVALGIVLLWFAPPR